MGVRDMWINLPVKDMSRSREFFRAIGFTLNPHHDISDQSSCFLIGQKNFVMMLFASEVFESLSMSTNNDTFLTNEMMLSIDLESRWEVEEMFKTVEKAGGTIFSGLIETDGWMYGFGFSDPDGHRWNVLHMDVEKLNASDQ